MTTLNNLHRGGKIDSGDGLKNLQHGGKIVRGDIGILSGPRIQVVPLKEGSTTRFPGMTGIPPCLYCLCIEYLAVRPSSAPDIGLWFWVCIKYT